MFLWRVSLQCALASGGRRALQRRGIAARHLNQTQEASRQLGPDLLATGAGADAPLPGAPPTADPAATAHSLSHHPPPSHIPTLSMYAAAHSISHPLRPVPLRPPTLPAAALLLLGPCGIGSSAGVGTVSADAYQNLRFLSSSEVEAAGAKSGRDYDTNRFGGGDARAGDGAREREQEGGTSGGGRDWGGGHSNYSSGASRSAASPRRSSDTSTSIPEQGAASGGGSGGGSSSNSSRGNGADGQRRGRRSRSSSDSYPCSGGSRGGGGGRGGASTSRRNRAGRGVRQQGPAASGRGRGGGGGGSTVFVDFTVYTTLTDLAEVVDGRVHAWAEAGNTTTLRAACHRALQLGMQPDEMPHVADRQPIALQHRVLITLTAAYLPIVLHLNDPVDCSTPLLVLTKERCCSSSGKDLAAALLGRLVGLLPAASCQALANSLYALGKLREECSSTPEPTHLLQQLFGEIRSRLVKGHDFTPQALSNMLWARAKLGYADRSLLRPLAAAAGRAAGRMEAQTLSNSLWALAALGCSGPEYSFAALRLCSEVQRHLGENPYQFTPQCLSNIVWALEGLQLGGVEEAKGAVTVAAEECLRRHFAGFNPQSISNTALALAKLGHTDQGWFSAVVEAALQQPSAMVGATPQDWSNLLYALSLVRHQPSSFLLHQGAVETVSRANPQECSNMLLALAGLCLYDQRMVDALARRLEELLQQGREQLTEQTLVNSLWALAVMGSDAMERHTSLLEQLLTEVVRRWGTAGGEGGSSATVLTGEGLVQLWQVQQVLVLLGAGSKRLASLLDANPEVLGAMRQAVKAAQADGNRSIQQKEVATALRRLQQQQESSAAVSGPAILSVEEEVVVEGLCSRVDVVVLLEGGRRVAVEVDGPSHFLGGRVARPYRGWPQVRWKAPEEVDGPTALRNRLLVHALGKGNVVSVPFWDWNKLGGNVKRQADYLRRLLGLRAVGRVGSWWCK